MADVEIAKWTYVAIIISLSTVTGLFFIFNPFQKVIKSKHVTYYFAGYFLLSSIGFVAFAYSTKNLSAFTVIFNNTTFLAAYMCLKLAFVSRQKIKSFQHSMRWQIIVAISAIPTTNLVLFLIDEGSMLLRTFLLITAIISINISIVKYIPIDTDKPNYGEKLGIISVKLTILFLLVLLASLVLTGNVFAYLSTLTLVYATILAIMLGAIQTILLSEVVDLYKKESTVDFLTQLFNRRHFMASSEQIMKLAKRTESSTCLIILDVDDFKIINDIFGHDKGDEVLKLVAQSIKKTTRIYDIAARYGGEEFVVLLPNTQIDSALDVAERLRSDIEQLLVASHICDIRVSCSFGVTKLNGHDNITVALKQADNALYDAKNNGKNCISQYSH